MVLQIAQQKAADVDRLFAAIAERLAYCWGNNDYGQIGDGTTETRQAPVQVGNLSGVSAISTDWGTTCAVAGTDAYCWGNNEYGQLGDGTEQNRRTPTRIDVRGATEVSTAAYGGCAAAGSSATATSPPSRWRPPKAIRRVRIQPIAT